jgi:hypothetical protein
MPPHSNAFSWPPNGDKAGENCFLAMGSTEGNDIRQHAGEPGHLPLCAFRKHALHIDADMYGGLARRSIAELIVLGHFSNLESQL